MSIIITTSPKNKKHNNNNQSKVFSPICTHSWGEESHNSPRHISIDLISREKRDRCKIYHGTHQHYGEGESMYIDTVTIFDDFPNRPDFKEITAEVAR